jgi:hypothetical protein
VQAEIALSGVIGALARTRSDLFYGLLLKDAGCSANAERMAALFGAGDQAAKRTSKLVHWSSPWAAFASDSLRGARRVGRVIECRIPMDRRE